jgi:IS1 family transposase
MLITEQQAKSWGKRDMKTAGKLKRKLSDLGITCGSIATDDRDSFVTVFKSENHLIGKKYTVGIEGNNCRLRHRIRRAFLKTCCFSKKLFNHFKAFNLAFFLHQFRLCIKQHTFYITTELLFL